MQNQNRNNRVHTEGQSGKTDFLIEGLLPVGKENAVTTQELVKMTGCGSARELQQRIAYEREHGALFVPDPAEVIGDRKTGKRYRNLYIQ